MSVLMCLNNDLCVFVQETEYSQTHKMHFPLPTTADKKVSKHYSAFQGMIEYI